MQFTTVAILLAAAIGANAAPAPAPADITKRIDYIPLSIYGGEKCDSKASQTEYIPTARIPIDGTCERLSPVYSGNTNSFFIDPANLNSLPAGCTLIVYPDHKCSSSRSRKISKVGKDCLTFGANRPIGSAKAIGC